MAAAEAAFLMASGKGAMDERLFASPVNEKVKLAGIVGLCAMIAGLIEVGNVSALTAALPGGVGANACLSNRNTNLQYAMQNDNPSVMGLPILTNRL